MPQELLWLLLPVAAASGWIAARRSASQSVPLKTSAIPRDYYKGINYFLSEQPDKAIDVFIGILEIDSETVEPHLALGNLFRRRGEVDRAIRIHQNLIARPSLTKSQRDQALLELGHDYFQAGLLDRAETLLHELTERDQRNLVAFKLLKNIYEQENEWHRAILAMRKIEIITGTRKRNIIAQYYCELAAIEIDAGEYQQAQKFLRKAQTSDGSCARAYIVQAELHRIKGHYKAAIKSYKRAVQILPECLAEIVEALVECFTQAGKQKEMMSYLGAAVLHQKLIAPVLFYTQRLSALHDDQTAMQFLSTYLNRYPSMSGLSELLNLSDRHRSQPVADNEFSIRPIIDKLIEEVSVYYCNSCGFSGNTWHWQCPGCRQWETQLPHVVTAANGKHMMDHHEK